MQHEAYMQRCLTAEAHAEPVAEAEGKGQGTPKGYGGKGKGYDDEMAVSTESQVQGEKLGVKCAPRARRSPPSLTPRGISSCCLNTARWAKAWETRRRRTPSPGPTAGPWG